MNILASIIVFIVLCIAANIPLFFLGKSIPNPGIALEIVVAAVVFVVNGFISWKYYRYLKVRP